MLLYEYHYEKSSLGSTPWLGSGAWAHPLEVLDKDRPTYWRNGAFAQETPPTEAALLCERCELEVATAAALKDTAP
jgi:hypothetical protein